MAIIAFTPRVQTALRVLVIGFIVSLFLSEEDLQHDHRLHLRQESSSSSRQLLGLSTANNDPANNGLSSSDGDSSDDPAQADAMDVSTFWWKDIDYDTKWQCGRFKCYFPSSSNPANGYLVQRRYTPQGRNAMKTYLYAKKLQAEHNITHCYSSPPFETPVPDYFFQRAADNDEFGDRFEGSGSVIVQPSRSAPEHSNIFKCTKVRKYHTLDDLIEYGHEGYEEMLLGELAQTISLVESNPKLVYDFQFMIDLDGRIYQIDLDRALNPKTIGVSHITKCLEDAMGYIRKSMD